MAMYYYASKLNEAASCSGCHRPQQLQQPPPPPPPPPPPLPPPLPSATDYFIPNSPPSTAQLQRRTLMNGGGDLLEDLAASSAPPPGYFTLDQNPDVTNVSNNVGGATIVGVAPGGTVGAVVAGGPAACSAVAGGAAVIGGNSTSGGCQPIPLIDMPDQIADLVLPDLEYREGLLSSGSLESLITLLRPGVDRNFIFTFLLCSRIYIKPHELLSILYRRHIHTEQIYVLGTPAAEEALNDLIMLVRIVGEWMRVFPYDFRDDRVMAFIRNITEKCAQDAMLPIRGEMSEHLKKLLSRLTSLEEYELQLNDSPQVYTVDKLAPVDVMSIGLSCKELARQLTLLEIHQLSFVGPEEFIQAFIPTSYATNQRTPRPHELKKTRNLEVYAKWFNRLSYLVASDILKNIKTKNRAHVLNHWMGCARECFNIGNFNSLMAIVGALNMVAVARLKKTWARCSGCVEQLPALEYCMDPAANHAHYRAALSAAGAKTGHVPVPCFSIICRDLHFINQTAPNRIQGNRINFDKCRSLAKQISEQLGRCKVETNFAIDKQAWEYLLNTPVLAENAMDLVSFEREPPYDHSEKERYKALRRVRP